MVEAGDLVARARRLALENALEHGSAPRAGPIVSRLLAVDPSLRPQAGAVGAAAAEAVRWVEGLAPETRAEELARLGGPSEPVRSVRAGRPELPDLPGALPGKVVLRMAPFPSGALHIGNSRMVFINDHYRTRYQGKLLLVFDDTVGSEEKRVDAELFDVIREDLEYAGVPVDSVFYKSDRLPIFYDWGRRTIETGAAYVCTCAAEVLREHRRVGASCDHRDQTVPETLEGWQRMLDGGYAVGEAVLRLRTHMDDPDPAFRDRVLFRLSDLDHPRVGRKYRVWPMLEFSWAVDDVLLGVTHVIRGKDLQIEDRMEQFLWKVLGLTGPPFVHWGILRVNEAKLSKSKSYREVKSGEFDGWADPRTWSIRSLVRRGISADSLREFTLSFGISLADIEVPAETLYAMNRVRIDPTTPRRAFALDPVRVEVDGAPPELNRIELPNHPERPELGRRSVPAGPAFYLPRADVERLAGTEVRLKELMNLQLEPAPLPPGGTARARFLGTENRKIPRLQWVGAAGAVPVEVLRTDGQWERGLGEEALASARPGDLFQFERFGFVRVEDSHRPGATPVRVCYGHP